MSEVTKYDSLFTYSKLCTPSILPHINHASNTITLLHIIKRNVDLSKVLAVGDELIDLEFAFHVVVDEIRELGTSFDTTESTSFPNTACYKLEC